MQFNLNLADENRPDVLPVRTLFKSTERTSRQRIVRELGKLLREHLSFSLDRVFTSEEQTPVIPASTDLVPDIWVAKLSRNPVRTRSVIEPSLVIEVQPSEYKVPSFLTRIRDYRAIESLHELLVIDPTSQLIELYRRRVSETWVVEDICMSTSIYLESICLDVPVEMFWQSEKSKPILRHPCGGLPSLDWMQS